MKVIVLSRTQFRALLISKNINRGNIASCNNLAFISISNWNTDSVINNNGSNALALRFDDITHNDMGKSYIDNEILFTEEHARQIINFCEKNKDKEIIYTHCEAGISRSGAVGEFVNEYYSTDHYTTFKNNNPQICPNPWVRKTLFKVYRDMFYD